MTALLLWAVKESLLRYIASAGGRVEADGVWNEGGFFAFPVEHVDGVPGAGEGAIQTSGVVRFYGHYGMPIEEIAAPTVEWASDEAWLSIEHGVPEARKRTRAWDLRPLVLRDGELRAGLVRVTDDGAGLFGGQYAQGTEFDPLRVRL